MTPKELSIAQIAARLGISERTARRWIETGVLWIEPGRRRGYYVADVDQLEQLARNDPDELTALRAELTALTRRVEELEQMSQPRARSAPTRRTDQTLPAGETTSARQFYEAHGLTRYILAGQIQRGEVQVTPTPRGKGQLNILTREQQTQAVAFWQQTGLPFSPCGPDCPGIHKQDSGTARA